MSDHDSISGLQRIFLENGEVHIKGGINDETAEHVHLCFLHLRAHGSPDVTVFIRSDGGVLDAGLHIYDEFRHYPGKTKGIVTGFAHSAAATLLQGCTKRLAYRHSTILVHDGSFVTQIKSQNLSNKDLFEMRDDMQKSMARTHKILAQHTKLTMPKIRSLMARDKKLSAQEALAIGLIDGIC